MTIHFTPDDGIAIIGRRGAGYRQQTVRLVHDLGVEEGVKSLG